MQNITINKYYDSTWNFNNVDTKISSNGIHTYPATMIPQIVDKLIEKYGLTSTTLLDLFMGSGTTLVEASKYNNFKQIYGIDINPLARLISKVKTTKIDENILRNIT